MTFAEVLLTIAIIGVLYAMAIPIVTADSNQKNNEKLFVVAYRLTENIISELITDPVAYEDGRFSNNTFCGNFMEAMNTVGVGNCMTSSVTPRVPNFTITNGMRWFSVDTGFHPNNCNDVADLTGNCIKVQVDVNVHREPNSEDPADPERDILSIYMNDKGKLGLPVGLESTYMESE